MITGIHYEDGKEVLTLVFLSDAMRIFLDGTDNLYIDISNIVNPYSYDFINLLSGKYCFTVYLDSLDDAQRIMEQAKHIAEKYDGCLVLNK